MIHRELYNRLTFELQNKRYMYKLESVQENETRRILSDFLMQTYHQISTRTCYPVDFAVPSGHRVKIQWSQKIANTSMMPEI